MGRQETGPVGWGFGITCGVFLFLLLLFVALLALSVLSCGGCASMFIVPPEPQPRTIEHKPPVPATPKPAKPERAKMTVERVDKDTTPHEFHVFVYADEPTDQDMRSGLDKIAADDDRKVYFYPSATGFNGPPSAVWLIRDYQFERLD